ISAHQVRETRREQAGLRGRRPIGRLPSPTPEQVRAEPAPPRTERRTADRDPLLVRTRGWPLLPFRTCAPRSLPPLLPHLPSALSRAPHRCSPARRAHVSLRPDLPAPFAPEPAVRAHPREGFVPPLRRRRGSVRAR